MKSQFLLLPQTEQAEYFVEAGTRRGLSPVIVDKDF